MQDFEFVGVAHQDEEGNLQIVLGEGLDFLLDLGIVVEAGDGDMVGVFGKGEAVGLLGQADVGDMGLDDLHLPLAAGGEGHGKAQLLLAENQLQPPHILADFPIELFVRLGVQPVVVEGMAGDLVAVVDVLALGQPQTADGVGAVVPDEILQAGI